MQGSDEMTGNAFRVQDEDGIIQVETLRQGLELIQTDPAKLAFVVDNINGQVVTVWMRDTVGVGDVWVWNHAPAYKNAVQFYLDEIERDTVDETGLTKAQREEIQLMLTSRGAEKIWEQLVYDVEEFTRENVRYPFSAADEDEAAEKIIDYAFEVFKKEFFSSKDHS